MWSCKQELSHYSDATSDVEYQFPFGWKELEGIAYRGNFDLTQHMKHSGKDLSVFDDTTQQAYIPHVVECSVGVDRLFLTLLFDSYAEEPTPEGDVRTVLRFHPHIAPIKAAFLPLTKTQNDAMYQIFKQSKKQLPHLSLQYDLSGSVGKRYRRQDEIGTPLCFTYDFESEHDHCVTVRNRDTMQQERVNITQINDYLVNTVE